MATMNTLNPMGVARYATQMKGLQAAQGYAAGANGMIGVAPGRDPVAVQAQLIQARDRFYTDNYVPLEKYALAKLNNSNLLEGASANLERIQAGDEARRKREMGRFGAFQDNLAKREAGVTSETNKALAGAQLMNSTRQNQRDLDASLEDAVVNIGRDIDDTTLAAYSGLAGRQTERDNAYAQAKSAYKQQQTNTAVGAATTIAMLVAM